MVQALTFVAAMAVCWLTVATVRHHMSVVRMRADLEADEEIAAWRTFRALMDRPIPAAAFGRPRTVAAGPLTHAPELGRADF